MQVMGLAESMWWINMCLSCLGAREGSAQHQARCRKENIPYSCEKQMWKIFSLNGLGSLFLL